MNVGGFFSSGSSSSFFPRSHARASQPPMPTAKKKPAATNAQPKPLTEYSISSPPFWKPYDDSVERNLVVLATGVLKNPPRNFRPNPRPITLENRYESLFL